MLGGSCSPCCVRYNPRPVPQCVRLYYSINSGKNGAFQQYSGFRSPDPFLYMCRLPNDYYIATDNTSSTERSLEYARYFWSDGLQTAQVFIQQNLTRAIDSESVTISREASLGLFLFGSSFQVRAQAVAIYAGASGGESPFEQIANYGVYARKELNPSFDGEINVCGTTYQAPSYTTEDWTAISGAQSPALLCSPTTFRTSGTYLGTAYSVDIDVTGVLDDLGAELLPLPIGGLRPIDLMVRG